MVFPRLDKAVRMQQLCCKLSLRRSFVYAGITSSVLEEVDKPRVKPPTAGLTVWEGAVSFLSLRE